jgi:hypothetical protein
LCSLKLISITGASGENSTHVNGEYRLTAAVSGGFAVYEKTTDRTRSIWHDATGDWMVGDTEDLGTDVGYASLTSAGVAPETRGTGGAAWQVVKDDDYDGWEEQPGVRVRFGYPNRQ